LATCADPYPSPERDVAVRYLEYVRERAQVDELSTYLSDDVLRACGPGAAEGPARRNVGTLVYTLGTEAQIYDRLRQMGNASLFCRPDDDREIPYLHARIASACAKLALAG